MKDFLFGFFLFILFWTGFVSGVYVKDEEPSTKSPLQVEELPWLKFFDRKLSSDGFDGGKRQFQRSSDLVSHSSLCPPGETGQFPYPPDCKRFINCWKGRGSIQVCAPGTLFNAETLECDFPGKVKCEDGFGGFGEQVPSATGARYVRFPHQRPAIAHNPRVSRKNHNELSKPDSIPDSIPARPHPGRPPYFGPSHLLPPTRPGSQSQGREVRPQCPLGATGLYPHPYDCSKFLKCWSGNTFIQNCGPGTFFNPMISACDHPRNVPCAHAGESHPVQTDESEITAEDVQLPEESVQYEQYQAVNLSVKGGKKTIKQDPQSPEYDSDPSIGTASLKTEADDAESGGSQGQTAVTQRKPKIINIGSNPENLFSNSRVKSSPATHLTPPRYDVYGNLIAPDNGDRGTLGVQPEQPNRTNNQNRPNSPKVHPQVPSAYPSDPYLITYPPQGPYSNPPPSDRRESPSRKDQHTHPGQPPIQSHVISPSYSYPVSTWMLPPPVKTPTYVHYAPYHASYEIMRVPYHSHHSPHSHHPLHSPHSPHSHHPPHSPHSPHPHHSSSGICASSPYFGENDSRCQSGVSSQPNQPSSSSQVPNVNPNLTFGFTSSGTIQTPNLSNTDSAPQQSSGSFIPPLQPDGTGQTSEGSYSNTYQPTAPPFSDNTPQLSSKPYQQPAIVYGTTGTTGNTYSTIQTQNPTSGRPSGYPQAPIQVSSSLNPDYPSSSLYNQLNKQDTAQPSSPQGNTPSSLPQTPIASPGNKKASPMTPQYQPYLFYYYPVNSNLYAYHPGPYYPYQSVSPQTPFNTPNSLNNLNNPSYPNSPHNPSHFYNPNIPNYPNSFYNPSIPSNLNNQNPYSNPNNPNSLNNQNPYSNPNNPNSLNNQNPYSSPNNPSIPNYTNSIYNPNNPYGSYNPNTFNNPQKTDSNRGQAALPDPLPTPDKSTPSPQYKPSQPVYVNLNAGSSQPGPIEGQLEEPDPFAHKNQNLPNRPFPEKPGSYHPNKLNENFQKAPVYVVPSPNSDVKATEPQSEDTATFPPFPGGTPQSAKIGTKTGVPSKENEEAPKQYLLGQIDVRTGAEEDGEEDAESVPSTQSPPPPRKREDEKVDETFVKGNTKKPLYTHPDKYSQPETEKPYRKPEKEETTKKAIKPESDFSVDPEPEEQKPPKQTKKPHVKVKQTPPNGQVVRLRNGASHLDGYLEMKDKKSKWGLICDQPGQWGIAEATVACRELGFIRGAELSWQGYPIKSESEDLHVAVNGIRCKGSETSLSECEVSNSDQDKCNVGRNAVGLRCFDNLASHCQPGEILYNQHCYKLHEKENPDDPWIRTEEASDQCKKRGGKLVDITSQYENDFISEWLIKKHPDVTAVATGGIGISVLGRPMWLWEGTSDPMVYERWWSGWSGDQDIPKGSIDGPLCIILRKTFSCSDEDGQKITEATNDEETCSADYFFWDVEDCDQLRTSAFICERPMDDIGCVVGNGEAYVGPANTTASGMACLPWDHPKAVEGLARRGSAQERSSRLAGHNHCRNLGNPDRHPWCFVEGKGNSEYCAIPRCWDSVSGSYSRSSGRWSSCDESHFECKPGECIRKEWVCDGQRDCGNGQDEEGCRIFLEEFTTERNKRLGLKGNERWANVNENICARLCLEKKEFKCRSFSYNFKDKDCILSEGNVGLSGQVVNAKGWSYHERISESVKCTLENGFFGCGNGKCVNVTNVCDGKRNCEDGTDERDCGRLGYQIRLAGSEEKHRGRVEVKVLGKWGVVCDDMFDMRDAGVVCRELGFKLGAAEVLKHSEFPVENPVFLVDQLECRGNETSIRECPFPGWGKHNCGPEEVVGVSCRVPGIECPEGQWQCKRSKECILLAYLCDGLKDCDDGSDEEKEMCRSPAQIRLAGGPNATSGRLEIRRFGIWGTVCHDDFSFEAGQSACSLLGFNGPSLVRKSAHFGAGKGPIWLDNGLCFVNETDLKECTKQMGIQNNCQHDEDVSLICSEGKSQQASSAVRPIAASSADEDSRKAEERLRQILISECSGKPKPKPRILRDQQEKVVGGSNVVREALPWQASVRVRSGSGKSSHWCGAVVISPYHVLTAGHCLRDYNKAAYFIRVGDYDTKVPDPHEREFSIEQSFMHSEFSKNLNLNNDIGLVKVKGEIPLGEHIKPACLAPSVDIYRPGTNCSISGWGTVSADSAGFARTLRRAFIPILEPSVCRAPYVYGDSLSEGMFCAGHLDGGVDSCQGDSGGPFMCQHEGREYLFGITSWGHGCGRVNKPGVYTNVAFYADWIQQKIRASLS